MKRFALITSVSILLFGLVNYTSAQKVNRSLWDSIETVRKEAYSKLYVNLDSARVVNLKLLELIENPIDSVVYSSLLHTAGIYDLEKGNIESAIEYYLKCLKIREQLGDPYLESNIHLSLANIYYSINDYEECEYYARKSIHKLQQSNAEERELSSRYNVIALIHFDKLEDDSAIFYFNKALKSLESDSSAKSNYSYYLIHDNLSQIYIDQGDYEKGIQYLRKSLEYSEANNYYADIAFQGNQIFRAFVTLGQLDSAKYYLTKIENAAQKSISLETQKEVEYSKLLYYSALGLQDSIVSIIERYSYLSDSLVDQKTNQNIQEMAAKYKLEKNQAELALSKEKAARFAAENKNQKVFIIAISSIAVILLIAFFLAFNSYKRKKKIAEMELEIKDSKLDELMSEQESKAYAAMLRGQEKERDRIARELHDRLGGTLAALKLSLKAPDNKVKEEDIKILEEAVHEVRSIAQNLSSGVIQKYGLNQALNQLFSTLERSGGLSFSMYLHPDIASLGQATSLELYRIVQELATNTIKHAKATEVSLQTNFEGNTFNLIYEDNGVGFNPKKIKSGMGLDNIKARVKKLSGSLHIDTEIGRGTIIIVELNKG